MSVITGLVLLALVGCSAEAEPSRPARQLALTVDVEGGRSSEIAFDVPDGTRSIAVVVDGTPTALYGLAELRVPGRPPLVAQMPALRAAYDEHFGWVSGPLAQSIRLGRFTAIYPQAAGSEVVAGRATVRIAGDTDGPVTVTILMPPKDGGTRLHLDVVRITTAGDVAETPHFLAVVDAIFGQAGITVVVDGVRVVVAPDHARIAEHVEPHERPDSAAARAALAVAMLPGAVPLVIVDDLPPGIGGLSLGTPGPPISGLYAGVLTEPGGNDIVRGRVIAHELAHYLGLAHVEDRDPSGALQRDAFADTDAAIDNLMGPQGLTLTSEQIEVLRKSPLLRLD